MKAFLKNYVTYCLVTCLLLLTCLQSSPAKQASVIKPLTVFFVNTNTEWQARAQIKSGHVEHLIFQYGDSRLFKSSHIDETGHGTGIDFRGKAWEFRGFVTKPEN